MSKILRTHVLPALGQYRLQQLQSTDIDKLYLGLEGKIAPRTARSVHTTFGACLGAAVRSGKLKINPMTRIMKTPAAGESDHGIALDDAELRKLIQGFKGSSLYTLVNVAAFTGARRNEIFALRWSDLDPQRKELRIERALERTKKHGLRFKRPKRESHKRTISHHRRSTGRREGRSWPSSPTRWRDDVPQSRGNGQRITHRAAQP